MLHRLSISLLCFLASFWVQAANPLVRFTTAQGNIELELFPDQAPKTVENFLRYVKKGQYDGTLFHRAIAGMIIQGGGHRPDMSQKMVDEPIVNEAKNGLSNVRGTLAMAREEAAHSARAQFFINLSDNLGFDYRDDSPRGFGYAVFGKVVSGMDLLDKMAAQPTTTYKMWRDVPLTPIIIQSAKTIPDSRVPRNYVLPPQPTAPVLPPAEP